MVESHVLKSKTQDKAFCGLKKGKLNVLCTKEKKWVSDSRFIKKVINSSYKDVQQLFSPFWDAINKTIPN